MLDVKLPPWQKTESYALHTTQELNISCRVLEFWCSYSRVDADVDHNVDMNLSLVMTKVCGQWIYIATKSKDFHRQAITTSGLVDLCPPASPELTGQWDENVSSPHGNYPKITSISHFHPFLNVNETCLILILIFWHLYPLKLAKIVVKCEIQMWPAPPSSLMNSGHRSKLQVVVASAKVH